MNSSDTRISTYLDDLARMLADLPPDERDDVLAGVREHLDATLAEHPDDPGAVDAALLRLGPPEQVAAEARAGQPPSAPVPRSRSRGWTVTAVVLTLLTTVPFIVDVLVMHAGILSAGVLGTPDGAGFGMFGPTGVIMFFVWPVWVVALIGALLAPGLSGVTRGWLVALGPLSLGVVMLASFFLSPPVLSNAACVVLLLALLGALGVTSVRAWREGHPS